MYTIVEMRRIEDMNIVIYGKQNHVCFYLILFDRRHISFSLVCLHQRTGVRSLFGSSLPTYSAADARTSMADLARLRAGGASSF